MHNINYIRENPTEFDNFMKTRGENPIANKIIEIDYLYLKSSGHERIAFDISSRKFNWLAP